MGERVAPENSKILVSPGLDGLSLGPRVVTGPRGFSDSCGTGQFFVLAPDLIWSLARAGL